MWPFTKHKKTEAVKKEHVEVVIKHLTFDPAIEDDDVQSVFCRRDGCYYHKQCNGWKCNCGCHGYKARE